MDALDAAAVRAVDTTGQMGEALDLAAHLRDALWRVDSAALAPVDAPDGLVVAGMGGSGVGGRLAAGALGPRLTRPLQLAMGYELPPGDRAAHARAVLVLLGRDGGDDRGLRRRDGGGRAARRGHDRRHAGRPGAGGPGAGGAAPRRLPAARGGRLRARHGAGGGGAVRGRARDPRRGRGGRRPGGAPGRRMGAGRPGGRRGQAARPRAGRLHPAGRRRRPHRAGGLPLEDPAQRARRAARLRRRAARARPQRGRGLGGGRAPARAPSSWRTRRPTRASPGASR